MKVQTLCHEYVQCLVIRVNILFVVMVRKEKKVGKKALVCSA